MTATNRAKPRLTESGASGIGVLLRSQRIESERIE